MTELVIIDTETTGINPALHDVWEVAFVPLDDKKPTFQSCIELPENNVFGDEAKKLFNKSVMRWRNNQNQISDVYQSIEAYLVDNFSSEVTLIGWNVGFDAQMLKRLAFLAGSEKQGSMYANLSYRTIDLHSMLWTLQDVNIVPSTVLSSSAAFKHFGVEPSDKERHTALGDAIATKQLFKAVRALLHNIGDN